MIDCSNVLNYAKERDRICEATDSCKECVLGGPRYWSDDCCNIKRITQTTIDIVQKWSDEHPAHTRRDKFLKLLKDNGFEKLICEDGYNSESNCGGLQCAENVSCEECKAYWNEVIE